jgi:hypothetical protein
MVLSIIPNCEDDRKGCLVYAGYQHLSGYGPDTNQIMSTGILITQNPISGVRKDVAVRSPLGTDNNPHVEGPTTYYADDSIWYLIASSQGNNTCVIHTRHPLLPICRPRNARNSFCFFSHDLETGGKISDFGCQVLKEH